MGFLELSPDLYEKFIVKLNVNRANKDKKGDNFVFVFSRCIDDCSTYGKVQIELVAEKTVPNFHESFKNEERMEVKDDHFGEDGNKTVAIGQWIKIIKNKSDFDTKYIAVVENEQTDQVEYHLLLTKNRGHLGKLEHLPYTLYPIHFEMKMLDHRIEQKINKIDTSIGHVKDLDGIDECMEEIVHRLGKQKSEVEHQVKDEYLRSFYKEDDN